MSLIASNTGKKFELCPVGVSPSRCSRIIDLGTQVVTHQNETKYKRQVLIDWETSNESQDGKRLKVSKKFTLSLDEKANLRKDLEAWRGRKFTEAELTGFDIANLLGKPVLLNIIHSDDGKYANIGSIMPLPGGMSAPDLSIAPVLFSLNAFDQDVFASLTDGLKAIIQKSPEYAEATGGGKGAAKNAVEDLGDDSIPF